MELRQLRYFVRIVELGSLTRAAADLFIAQPALSQQVAALEGEFNVRLLSRSVRGVTPTDAGLVFYRHAQSILRLMERLRADVQHAGADPTGLVSIGMPTSVANVLATPVIAAAQARYPGIRLQIIEGLSGHLRDLVVNGRVEMSVLFDATEVAGAGAGTGSARQVSNLHVKPLLIEELFFLSAGKKRFGRTLTLAQAAEHRFVLPGGANATRQIVNRAFEAAGLTLNVIAELDSLPTIKSVVQSGLAAAILSASVLSGATHHDGVTAHRISDVTLTRAVSLCTYDIVALSAAASFISELIVEVSAALIRDGTWIGAVAADGEAAPQA
jgi:LysR family nitrogen assimilation transcriptional regulator